MRKPDRSPFPGLGAAVGAAVLAASAWLAAAGGSAHGAARMPEEPAASPSPSDPEARVAGRDVPVPKRIKFVAPAFPPDAIAQGLRGIVVVELIIDEQGHVATAEVVRSVPTFDEAALAAARQWEYEVTKVDGKPVKVRLPVPITFALKLPDMEREVGIPELRQGAAPMFPSGAKGPGRVVADVTLHPDGSVAEAGIQDGDSPWSEAVLQALRTWRFAVDSTKGAIAFDVHVGFVPGPPQRVELRLTGLRTAETPSKPAEAATPPPSPAAASPDAPAPSPSPEAPPSSPQPSPAPVDAPSPSPAPVDSPAPGAPDPAPSPSSPGLPQATEPPAPAPSPSPSPGSDPDKAAPPVEVIVLGPAPTAPPSTVPSDYQGVSTVRDVTIAMGIPDLAKGRRPVSPPLARIMGVNGRVDVKFSVDAAGATLVQDVKGPEALGEAARQAVNSWAFRRTTAERVYLVATFDYKGDQASAQIRRQEQP